MPPKALNGGGIQIGPLPLDGALQAVGAGMYLAARCESYSSRLPRCYIPEDLSQGDGVGLTTSLMVYPAQRRVGTKSDESKTLSTKA